MILFDAAGRFLDAGDLARETIGQAAAFAYLAGLALCAWRAPRYGYQCGGFLDGFAHGAVCMLAVWWARFREPGMMDDARPGYNLGFALGMALLLTVNRWAPPLAS